MDLAKAQKRMLQYQRQWKLRKWVELMVYALSVAAVIGSITMIFGWLHRFDMFWLLPILVFISSIMFFPLIRPTRDGKEEINNLLNQQFSELEHSAHLLWPDYQPQNKLEQLQIQKIYVHLLGNTKRLSWKNLAFQDAFTLSLCILMLYFSSKFTSGDFGKPNHADQDTFSPLVGLVDSIEATQNDHHISWMWRVIPPAYTKVKPYQLKDFSNTAIEEGSLILLDFKGFDASTKLFAMGGEALYFKWDQTREVHHTSFQINQTQLLKWEAKNQADEVVWSSDWISLHMKPDKAPQIRMKETELYHFIDWKENWTWEMIAEVSDDYGLQDAAISVTISRGKGESVKFREKKISPKGLKKGGVSSEIKAILSAKELSIEAGDEMYMFLTVRDNKNPNSQITRTDTYFFHFNDPNEQPITMEGGLGINLLPEYFRSQRQIIIDTEALIAERRMISEESFQQRSNELGIDQKLLRLRYGKFIGEEFESGIGNIGRLTQIGISHDDHDHDDHDHDHDHQHNGHQHDDHDHEREEDETGGIFGSGSGISEGDYHAHDSSEEATFLDEGLKVKLKAALAQMWEAELRLRIHDPKAALPFEYKALTMIKEIQQESRVYVERVGFEPPPIKVAEKRMTGELKDAENAKWRVEISMEEQKLISKWEKQLRVQIVAANSNLDPRELASYLAELIRKGEPIPLKSLQIAEKLNKETPEKDLYYLIQVLRTIYPESSKPAIPREVGKSELAENYLKKLTP
jgi:hypothetical protein